MPMLLLAVLPAHAACADLHAVDWANHTYPFGLGIEAGLSGGKARVQIDAWDSTRSTFHAEVFRWTLDRVVYGDLDGDGCDEAVVWLLHDYEGDLPRGGPRGGQGFVWSGTRSLGRVWGAPAAKVRIELGAVVVDDTRWIRRGEGLEIMPMTQPAGGCLDPRSVDWANHVYPLGFSNGLAYGRSYAALDDPGGATHSSYEWRLLGVAYGDFDGDGCDDALPWIEEKLLGSNGHTLVMGVGWVWRMEAGHEVRLARATGGTDVPKLGRLTLTSADGRAVLGDDGLSADTGLDPACRALGQVDWANRSYPGVMGGRLRDGHARYEEFPAGPGDTWANEYVRLRAVLWGDLDGDGCDEALVWLHVDQSFGSTGHSKDTVYVFAASTGDLLLVGTATRAEDTTPRVERGVLWMGSERWRRKGDTLERLP